MGEHSALAERENYSSAKPSALAMAVIIFGFGRK